MFDRKGGVGVMLAKDAPYLTRVQCVAHRHFLTCSDAAKAVSFLKSYKDAQKDVYIYVSGSGKTQSQLNQHICLSGLNLAWQQTVCWNNLV